MCGAQEDEMTWQWRFDLQVQQSREIRDRLDLLFSKLNVSKNHEVVHQLVRRVYESTCLAEKLMRCNP